jgi:ubiquinone/menaquinone biosynthesis C-methylase UbiE
MKRIIEPDILMLDEDQCREFYEAHREGLIEFFIDQITYHKVQGDIADLGCGPADYSFALSREFENIHIDCYDGSPTMIEIARDLVVADNKKITLYNTMFNDIKKTYDWVISTNTLHHFENPNEFWNVVKNISKPNANVFIMDLARPESEEIIEQYIEKFSFLDGEIFKNDFRNSLRASFTKEELEEQLKTNGLETLSVDLCSFPLEILIVSGTIDNK